MSMLEQYNAAVGGVSMVHVGAEHHSVSELEHVIAQQREQLSAAVQYLQEAAYLAHYHQPSLERSIRAFLSQIQP